MAIQVTGFFKNPQSGLIYDSPLLELVPHLLPQGNIALDVTISGGGGTVGYQSIDKSTLNYNCEIKDVYSQLIDALQTFVVDNLKDSNDINKNSKFENYVKPVPEQVVEESSIEEPAKTISL
ncbi:hypothetical protein N9795_00300 [Candidatus Pelagibacter sp.]|nr:hypothetical protein [Candidatus Pelagibacter sp.]